MSGEVIILPGTKRVLEANGVLIANNTLVQADDATYNIFVHGSGYRDAKFVASFTFATAPTEGTDLALFAQPLDIEGTNDAEVPEMTRPTVVLGTFVVNNVTTTQYAELIVRGVPWNAAYYLGNRGTGQSVSAGWGLAVIPCTDAPAA